MSKGKIFAFDIGTGSLGIAVRDGDEIIEARSLLIPPDFASTKEQRERRRQWRTRIAHKKREEWLQQICKKAGIEVLEGRKPGYKKKGISSQKGDPRLEREFASPGDDTVYTSCLLRIKLLRGEKLEGWQIYKALHSAIQRRGFDPSIPWKRKAIKKGITNKEDVKNNDMSDDNKDEKENLKKAREYEKTLMEITHGKEDWNYPCYFDAYCMKLWNPETDELRFIQTHEAERARSNEFSPSRRLVEKELRDLINAAAKQCPSLVGKTDYIMYGPTETSYASYYPKLRKQYGIKEGGENDWQGAISQKIPRFDNRMPDKCALIPRYNVCRARDHLTMKFTFLMKLKNMRYKDSFHQEHMLTAEDIRVIFDEKTEKVAKKKKELITKGTGKNIDYEKMSKIYQYTSNQWTNWLKKYKNGYSCVNHEKVDPPKISGRARYCRPAMRIMCDLILSGKSPWEFYNQLLEKMDNENPKKGLVNEDIEFLLKLPDNWEGIYIPQYTLAERFMEGEINRDSAIKKVINKQRDPIIRHRMEIFKNYIDRLTNEYGIPEKVVIELVRQDFLGPKAKRAFEKWQRENRKRNEEARNRAKELGISGHEGRTKLRLFKQQNGYCLYTGENLSENELEQYEIDHIVPRGGGYNGSDSFINKVVTKAKTNHDKGDRTPYEFLSQSGKWDAYLERVKKVTSSLGKKKSALLTSEHPEELDEKYTQLAETAWIARIARDIVCLFYGWQYGEKGELEKALVVDGKLTSNVRAKYGLNTLLAGGNETDPEKRKEKNRDDKRHHALDAMVLSFITRNKPDLPEGVHKELFRKWINKVVPEQIAFEKPQLEETIYGKRTIYERNKEKEIIVKRVDLKDMAYRNGKYDKIKAQKEIQGILDVTLRKRLERFLETNPEKETWNSFIDNLRQQDRWGSRVKKVRIYEGEPDEYANLSKTDDKGQFRRGDKHRGQFVYLSEKKIPKVRPVYVFESVKSVKNELLKEGYEIIDFFKSGFLIEIGKSFDYNGRFIPSGKYLLSSLRSNGQVQLNSTHPNLKNPIGISALLKAGFIRIK